jgi:VWFA-related protein
MKAKPLGLLTAGLLISALAWPPPATSLQPPTPQPPAAQPAQTTPAGQASAEAAEPAQVLPPVSVEVVRVEVVVTEKRGQPHTGLTRDDFVVLEDGKPQPIVQFQGFARPARGPLHPEPEPPSAGAGEEPPAEEQLPARYIVLAVDDVHMDMANMVRAKKALVRFLREDLRTEDQVALVTTSGAQALSQEFTTDRELLEHTLGRLSPQPRRAEWMTVPYLTDYQAELIEAGDPFALDAAVQEVLAEGVFQDQESAEREARRKARAVLTEAVYNSRLTLEALDSLCRGLAGVSGRKALFLVSDGFLTGLTVGSGLAFDIRRIVDAGTRAGVVIYSLDTRGLVGSPGIVAASSAQRVQAQTAGLIESMRRRGDVAVTDAMNALAEDTGGFLVENRNDLRVGLREMLKDTETYYLIAYEPTNTRRDGSFRKIEVKVPGLKGVKVRARSGYYAPDDKRLLAAAGGSPDEARRNEQRRAEMQIALGSLAPINTIPVRLSADYASFDRESTQLVVSGAIDVSTLPFVLRHGRRQATVESVAVVMNDEGEVLQTLETDRTSMDLEEADFERLRRTGIPYEKAVPLEPGRYQVRLAVRQDATGLLGSAWQRVEIPSIGAGRLALSSLFLLKEGPPPGGQPEAGAPGGGLILHNAQAWRHFVSGENLYAQIYAYNPRRDNSGATSLISQAEILKGGVTLGTAAPEPIEPPEPGAPPTPHISRIRLSRFEPGEYELRVTVTDQIANATSARRVAFTID